MNFGSELAYKVAYFYMALFAAHVHRIELCFERRYIFIYRTFPDEQNISINIERGAYRSVAELPLNDFVRNARGIEHTCVSMPATVRERDAFES